MSGIVGRTHLERGEPVVIVAQWSRSPATANPVDWLRPPRNAPRNVLIRRGDGSWDVRPFRGLRTPRPA